MIPSAIQMGSFRDPRGFLFYKGVKLLRQVNMCYQENYDFIMNSALYAKLTGLGLLVEHTVLENHEGYNSAVYKIIEPEMINFISHP